MEAGVEMTFLNLMGGPRRGPSVCCSIGVAAFDMKFELSPERQSVEEIESGLCDIGWIFDPTGFTIRVVGCKP